MSLNTTTKAPNIPILPSMPIKPLLYDQIMAISAVLIPLFYYISMVGDLLMLIFFFQDFFKKKSQYRKPYYILLAIGYTFHFCDNIFTHYIYEFIRADFSSMFYFTVLYYVRSSYFNAFFSFWNAALVLNKITALWLPFKHEKIWTRNFKKIICIMLVTPFLPSFYIFANFNCTDYAYYNTANGGAECDSRIRTTGFISTGVTFGVIGILIILIISLHRKTISTFTPQIAKIEKLLLFQALTSLILYGIFRTIELIASKLCIFFNDCSMRFQFDNILFLLALSTIVKVIIQIPYLFDIFLLIVISKSIRMEFFNFYTFGFYQRFFHKSSSSVGSFFGK